MAAQNRGIRPSGGIETLLEQLGQLRIDHERCTVQGSKDCWVLDNLVKLNQFGRHSGVELSEAEPGVISLRATSTRTRSCENFVRELVLMLIEQHYCIKHFHFEEVSQCVLERMLKAMRKRTDIVSVSLTEANVEDNSDESSDDSTFLHSWIEKEILQLLRKSETLEKFELHRAKMSATNAHEIGKVLAKRPSLKKLLLRSECEHVSLSYLQHLNEILRKNSPFRSGCNITSLFLQGSSFRVCLLLDSLLTVCNTVTHLDLSGDVDLDRNSILNSGIVEFIKDEGATAVARALWSNATVKTLILDNAGFGRDGAAALAEMLCNNGVLTHLNISHNPISADGCADLAGAIMCTQSLKELKMERCSAGTAGATHIVTALKENSTDLVVDFGECSEESLTSPDVAVIVSEHNANRVSFRWTTGSILHIGSIPACCSKIREIHFTCETANEDAVNALCAYLRRGDVELKSLKVLFFQALPLVCIEIAQLLAHTVALEELSFECQRVPTNLLKTLAISLEKNTSLRKLHVSAPLHVGLMESIKPSQTKPLAEMLTKNKTLETLDFGIAFRCPVLKRFALALEKNYALTAFKCNTKGNTKQSLGKVQQLCSRNQLQQQQALHFVEADLLCKRWAEAFSLTRLTGTLRNRVAEATGKGDEEAERAIRAKWVFLCANYFRITGVVRDEISCYRSSSGATQMDKLDRPCIARIASFLSVQDVKEVPGGTSAG